MKNRNIGLLLGVGTVLMALLGNGCEFVGGSTGGSETTNGLAGNIKDEGGRPVVSASVILLPETYNPIPGKDSRALQRTTTDNLGHYRFSGIAGGVYNLEARDTVRQLQLLIQGIPIDSGKSPLSADGIVKNTGSLEIPFVDRYLPENAQAYVPGTTYHTFTASKVNMQGNLVLENLSAGLYTKMLVMSPDLPNGGPISISNNFHIDAGVATKLTPLQDWQYSTRIKLDPSGIVGPLVDAVEHYPLLVRLNSQNFDFSQTRLSGEDIRFTREDGTRLPHQIERWDVPGKSATIWVLVDSLPRRTVDTSVTMHWGRIDAMDISKSGQVFDTAQGFSSVWHFSEEPNLLAGGYRDATVNANHATATAPNTLSQVPAVAGMGKKFVDVGGQLVAPLAADMAGNSSFTITFWMNYQVAPMRTGVLYFGQQEPNLGFHFLVKMDTMTQIGPWDLSPVPGVDAASIHQNTYNLAPYVGKWVHVATVYDAAKQTLSSYINGEIVAVNSLPPMNIQFTNGVHFGTQIQNQSNLQGKLDEVRFYHRVLPESWIRMEYATQKENSTIISLH